MCSAVCQARDVGALTTSDGIWMPYMVLEWLEGDSLDAVLRGERERGSRPRTLEEAARILSPIAEALACAHARGIVHCDVKPGNIMVLPSALDSEKRCKLLDFGIARVTGDGSSVPSGAIHRAFTPGYAAPEQFDPAYGPTGPWTDIYALALIVVEMVCGRVALKGDGVAALCLRSCDPERRPSPRALGVDVGERAELVLDRALALRPEDRFANVRSFWAELSGTTRGQVSHSKRPVSRLDSTAPFDLRRLRPSSSSPPVRRARHRAPGLGRPLPPSRWPSLSAPARRRREPYPRRVFRKPTSERSRTHRVAHQVTRYSWTNLRRARGAWGRWRARFFVLLLRLPDEQHPEVRSRPIGHETRRSCKVRRGEAFFVDKRDRRHQPRGKRLRFDSARYVPEPRVSRAAATRSMKAAGAKKGPKPRSRPATRARPAP